jgi:glutamate-5-semialdehyde dehydrogenase
MSGLADRVERACREARAASAVLARAPTKTRNGALLALAEELDRATGTILEANAEDLEAARRHGASGALLDRLALDPQRVQAMARGLRELVALPDPLGSIEDLRPRPNGLLVGRMRIPLGVVAMIYEARPNVTADAAGLGLKSGNAVVLRGGSEAFRSNRAIGEAIARGLAAAGLPAGAVQVLDTPDRAAVDVLLAQDPWIDLVIPRGSAGLVRSVRARTRIPVLAHAEGVCHVFVDASADPEMAEAIAVNAKVQRPGVCNAMETLLVHREAADGFLPRVVAAMRACGVEIRGCPESRARVPDLEPAAEDDFGREFLDLVLALRVVADLDEAIAHIRRYGSRHTDAIVTRDHGSAMRFLREVDSSLVLVNASTRFNDGGQLGLGAEIGISTTPFHAFGPMGLQELTARKWVAFGSGQVREG